MTETKISVPAIHCDHCKMSLEVPSAKSLGSPRPPSTSPAPPSPSPSMTRPRCRTWSLPSRVRVTRGRLRRLMADNTPIVFDVDGMTCVVCAADRTRPG